MTQGQDPRAPARAEGLPGIDGAGSDVGPEITRRNDTGQAEPAHVRRNRLNLACQSKRHPHAERGLDCYQSPPCAVEALLSAERLPHVVWEPAAGRGNIVRVLRDAGHAVVASDIRDYGFPLHFRCDFLAETKVPARCAAIVTNPPYRLAQQFVAHALELSPLVLMLLRLAFLESERRSPLIDGGHLARVHVFKRRLPMMHRDGWSGPRASSAVPFAWFVFDRGYHGPTMIDRMSWGAR
jgi:hypothetical protein